jgi:hypothetical protein
VIVSLFKYFGEQGDLHGGRLFWSRNLPVPFRGSHAPTLTNEELESQVDVQYDYRSEFFDFSKEDQKAKYDWVMDRIVNGLFTHHFIDRHVDHEKGVVTVYIEWSQRYAQLSPQAKAARSQGHVLSAGSGGLQSPAWNAGLAGQQSPSSGI